MPRDPGGRLSARLTSSDLLSTSVWERRPSAESAMFLSDALKPSHFFLTPQHCRTVCYFFTGRAHAAFEQNRHKANFLRAKWKQSFTAKPLLIYYPKFQFYYRASDSLVAERGIAPLDRWFCVTQKELADLQVSVLRFAHYPISESSRSLAHISTMFFFFNFPYL